MSYGEIYKITNITNGKIYIGQAVKYQGQYHSKWGTEGRWKSHISDAHSSSADHCRYLNMAIRKYGEKSFKVEKILDCDSKEEMDEKEKEYITKYDSLHTSGKGYNLCGGGANGKDSEETKLKKSQSKIGIKQKPEHTEMCRKSQLGNRRDAKKRTYEEDNNLPKYLIAKRKQGNIVGYCIDNFPIGVNSKKYLSFQFFIGKYGSKDLALKAAMKKLEELKEEYSYIF